MNSLKRFPANSIVKPRTLQYIGQGRFIARRD